MIKIKPPQNLPQPLKGADPDSFAENTVKIRMIEIGRRVLAENNFSEQTKRKMIDLVEDLPHGQIRQLEDPNAPDVDEWRGYISAQVGKSWLEVPWFFAETYFYRRIIEATGYYAEEARLGLDPYSYQKHEGLVQYDSAIRSACQAVLQWVETINQDKGTACRLIPDLLKLSLWGNQADLSMWPVGGEQNTDSLKVVQDHRRLLVDDSDMVVDYVYKTAPIQVDIILDNNGMELVSDLLASCFLLQTGLAHRVILHAKSHPTFVSDTIILDVYQTLDYLKNKTDSSVTWLVTRLESYLKNEKLCVVDDYYWTSPLAFWDAPTHVHELFTNSGLLMIKGDANYRRFLGDRHWVYDTLVWDALGYFRKPLLLLRVSKSEVMVGLKSGLARYLDQQDSNWMFNGKNGLIQFVMDSSS